MPRFNATVHWRRGDQPFVDNRYSRAHEWLFDGGAVVPASASPHIVPLPMSVAENVDPEEAYVASLASCHMLFFLSLAVQRGIVVDDYVDRAIGKMGKNERGGMMVSEVVLFPEASYSGASPSRELIATLHEEAHEQCFIANSVRTEIRVEPVS
ncbi:OsmC family protein [Woeseia oceani]|uniref:Peroxiredoxin n=1 Tax=Woeseia oceani TaxID=1548547 RepID=A0A193LHM5_9GAMM|nr:OsmC family protein [Woeseia oceani]ANO52020.1 peroxiredoxin [Woeseia oceani]